MKKTLIVFGYGVGISRAVARKFSAEGFQLALVARDAEKLADAVQQWKQTGAVARAFPCDVSDSSAIPPLIANIRESLGPITVLHWNAHSSLAGDLTNADLADLRKNLDTGVVSLVSAVQQALPDLREAKGTSAVLITGGGYALYEPQIDSLAARFSSMGLAVTKAAQHKLSGVLHQKLKAEGIYVGEVTVLGLVKGTAHDRGNATIEASAVADRFWEIYSARGDVWASVS
jgi:NADP-dependent 3-hydroxy acid dehydrogenase YdfG